MKFPTLLPLLSLTAAVSGYTIPEGQPDGIYSVTFSPDGTPITTLLVDIAAEDAALEARGGDAPSPRGAAQPLNKRDQYGLGSGQYFPVHDYYNTCTWHWKNFFQNGQTLNSRSIIYCSRGTAALVACNYNNFNKWVPPQTVDQFNGICDNMFGWWRSCWIYSDAYGITLWRDILGQPICTNLNGGSSGGGSPYDP